jgi:PAS domain S-box-containing protein
MGDGVYTDGVLALATRAELCQPCVIVDPAGPDSPIVYVTPEFEAQTGYAAAEAIGRNCRFLQGPGTDPASVTKIRKALAAQEAVRVTILNYRRDGSPFMNRLAIRPVFGSTGALQAFVGVQRVLAMEPKGIVSRYTSGVLVGAGREAMGASALERRHR